MIHITELMSGYPLFKALDSPIRIKILELLLKEKNLNMNEIASALELTNAAITMHVKKLEECGIISIGTATGKHGTQKICYLNEDKIIIDLINTNDTDLWYESEINVGHYSSYQVFPTCGLATKDALIGEVDDPRYFAAPERVNAGVLWFSKGFVEYMIPNYIKANQKIKEIQIEMEIASEAPGYCENWPSDIYMYFNGIELGSWLITGDYGETRGLFNPSWWPNWNQHGVLKLLTINNYGTFIDGLELSNLTLDDLNINYKSEFTFRLAVPDKAKNIGGLTIYGKNFGNYNRGIKVRILYNVLNSTELAESQEIMK